MRFSQNNRLIYVVVFAVAMLSRSPALDSWWCLDDWGQLARAAGILDRDPGLIARWLSQDLWWSLAWPVLGLNPVPHAAARLVLHGISAVLVVRLAYLGTGRSRNSLVAGVLFAASPIAFTVLYWASGIQELLAGVLVLAAAERWWRGSRWGTLWALIFGIASIMAKESGFGLPILLGLHLWWCSRYGSGRVHFERWVVLVLLLVAVGLESAALMQNFATGPSDPYHLGGPLVVLGNIGIFGWWLGTPGPIFTAQFTWTIAGIGGLLFVIWGIWSGWCWHRNRRLPLVTWLGALLSLGPALPLVQQTHPYLAYVAAAALSLALAEACPERWLCRRWLTGLLVAGITLVGLVNMNHRMLALRSDNQPADPVVRAATLARPAAQVISSQVTGGTLTTPLPLVLLQPPITPAEIDAAARLGDLHVISSPRYAALGGSLGPSLIAGAHVQVRWVNSLRRVPRNARVLCETGSGFQVWGPTRDALLYATLSDLTLGHFAEAQQNLAHATDLGLNWDLFPFNPQLLKVPEPFLRRRAAAFNDWLQSQQSSGILSPTEATRLRIATQQLLQAVAAAT